MLCSGARCTEARCGDDSVPTPHVAFFCAAAPGQVCHTHILLTTRSVFRKRLAPDTTLYSDATQFNTEVQLMLGSPWSQGLPYTEICGIEMLASSV